MKENNKKQESLSKVVINWYPGHMAKTKREIKEKTGLIITNYKLVYVSPIFENHPVLKPFLNIGYLCFVDNSDVIISDEHLDYKWVSVEELASYLDKDIYNDLLKNGMIRELNKLK